MPSEPTIPVPMTKKQRDAIDWAAPEVRLSEVARELEAVVDAFDAAAARPAEPERTVRWCETHDRSWSVCRRLMVNPAECREAARDGLIDPEVKA